MRQELLSLLNNYNLDSLKGLEEKLNQDIKEGVLLSSGSTKKVIISNYIPRFVNDETYTKSFGYEWNIFNKTQLDSNTKTSTSKDRWESITNYKVDEMGSKRILEVGFLDVKSNNIPVAISGLKPK